GGCRSCVLQCPYDTTLLSTSTLMAMAIIDVLAYLRRRMIDHEDVHGTPGSSPPECRHGTRLERRSAGARGSAIPAGQGGRLLDPIRQLLLVELVRLAHIQGAHVLEFPDG